MSELGIVLANFVSTCAGMTFSFVVNGLFTFKASRLTLRQALLFLATTGLTLWVLQPIVILLVLQVVDVVLVAKLAALGVCLVVNFVSYRLSWSGVAIRLTGQPRGSGRSVMRSIACVELSLRGRSRAIAWSARMPRRGRPCGSSTRRAWRR